MGKQLCLAMIANSELEPCINEDPQPSPDEESFQIANFSKKMMLEELLSNKALLENNGSGSSSGSDSDPSEDNLDPDEVISIYPLTATPKPKAGDKRPNITKKRAESKRSLTSQKERIKIILKCKNCLEPELPGHVCPKPKPKLRPIIKPQPTYNNYSSLPYYNAAGIKVRDQATQTLQIVQSVPKKIEEQKSVLVDKKNAQTSPIKKDNRVSYRANSSDQTSAMGKIWKQEKPFPNLSKNSRKTSAWKHSEPLNK